ncbi:restriction endonuclease S subunit [Mycoplasma wenyonii str. Massachusetts]|uniref:Restriction endonuclease S subunit n=1 Tax=Mycoplasma wenyonii (strain Massachusetts) TaxID=1197325 RepID=I6YLW5_MYCWM|nr:restriction endonuclease S subunit [Mycoplasma wenyonii str. Massachusetts]
MSIEIPKEQLLSKYLLVEDGDFICNYGNLKALGDKQAPIYLYRERGPALISKKNYVFRANAKLANEDFLKLAFTSPSFLSRLSVSDFKDKQTEKFWEKFKDLGVNFPDLWIQERIVKQLETMNKLLEKKTNINKELERWMELQFQLLGKDRESLETKSFQELFEIVKGVEKFSEKQKRCNYRTIKSKFISAGMCDPTKEGCEFCNYQFCKADKLLLSKRVYEGKDQKYLLRLWVGCDGSASIDSFISIFPKKKWESPIVISCWKRI